MSELNKVLVAFVWGFLRGFIIGLILIALLATFTACANKVEVPKTVEVKSAPVTGEITVKHIIQIELPTIFTDMCKQKFADDVVAYNACVSEYIDSIVEIIGGLDPKQVKDKP